LKGMGETSDQRASAFSPRTQWSPITAALHRRRQVGEKTKNKVLGSLNSLDLEDEDDIFFKSPPVKRRSEPLIPKMPGLEKTRPRKSKSKSPTRRKRSDSTRQAKLKKKEAEEDLKRSLAQYTPEVRAKLAKVFDPTTPMKERLQVEVDMMKIPDERKILAELRYKVARKSVNVRYLENLAANEENLQKNLAEEAVRAKEEEKELARLRKERIDEEKAKKERDQRLRKEVDFLKKKGIAEGAEELRKEAEKTAEAAVKNHKRKIQKQREKEQMIQDFKDGIGKDMTEVNRELAIARLLNEEV